jgi:hypothetical protein
MPFALLDGGLSVIADRVATRTRCRLSIGRQLTDYCGDRLSSRQLTFSLAERADSGAGRHVVAIGRNHNSITISCHEWMLLERPKELLHRLIGVLTILLNVPLSHFQMIADLSDGEDGGPGMVAFCSRHPTAVLIPDHGFIRTRGQENHRRVARANCSDWTKRSDQIVWRGATTGQGTISKPHLCAHDPELLLRVRLCLALKDVPGTEAKLTCVAQSHDSAVDDDRLTRAGIRGEYISPIAWNGHKFAIDIDGNANAFSNLLTRLIMGCCVLKVASPLGYRQWYYGELEPWTHYVPVRADLSDLRDQITWCRENIAACREIAARGQAFAMARDYDTELASAARRLCEAHETGAVRRALD